MSRSHGALGNRLFISDLRLASVPRTLARLTTARATKLAERALRFGMRSEVRLGDAVRCHERRFLRHNVAAHGEVCELRILHWVTSGDNSLRFVRFFHGASSYLGIRNNSL